MLVLLLGKETATGTRILGRRLKVRISSMEEASISLSPYLIELALFSGWVYPKIVSGSNRIGK